MNRYSCLHPIIGTITINADGVDYLGEIEFHEFYNKDEGIITTVAMLNKEWSYIIHQNND